MEEKKISSNKLQIILGIVIFWLAILYFWVFYDWRSDVQKATDELRQVQKKFDEIKWSIDTLTIDTFNSVKIWMTEWEVRKTIGKTWTVTSEYWKKWSPYYTIMYWVKSTSSLWANASFTFQNEKLQLKSQFGLE